MDTPDSIESELARLRRRVEELEATVLAQQESEARLQETEERLRRLVEATSETIAILDGGIVVDVNPRVMSMFGYAVEEAIGQSALTFIAPESRELVMSNIRSGNEVPYEGNALRKDGSTFVAQFCGRTVPYLGRMARVTIVLDLTEQKRVEEAHREAIRREEVIRAQAATLAALSTPLLPILDGVLVMPLIGTVTTERARQVIETLARGVSEHRAAIAILDITGVGEVDETVADALLSAARTVGLLGARLVLTGVRPVVAATFVQLGAELSGLVTRSSLEQGIAYAIGQR